MAVALSDSFWPFIGGFRWLGYLRCTSKALNAEYDLVVAVKALNKKHDSSIQKVWAKRWLGVRDHWMAHVKAADLTLVMAIEIAVAHGGLNHGRAVVARQKMLADKAQRRLEHAKYVERVKQLVRRVNELLQKHAPEIPPGYFDMHIRLMCPPTAVVEQTVFIEDLVRRFRHDEQVRVEQAETMRVAMAAMTERKAALDARLAQEGLLPNMCHYYDLCLLRRELVIDDAMMIEYRFQTQLMTNQQVSKFYEQSYNALKAEHGGNFAGLNASIRDMVRANFMVDERGNIGARRAEPIELESPEFNDDYSGGESDI